MIGEIFPRSSDSDLVSLFLFLSNQTTKEIYPMKPVQTLGKATLYRKESYNHRTTALVVWIVKFNDQIVRECTTKREALEWLNIYKD